MNLQEVDMDLKIGFRGEYDYTSRQIKFLLFLLVCTNMTIESGAITDDASFLD